MSHSPSLFLCYAREDKSAVESIYIRLKQAGLAPWMDKPPHPYSMEGLQPGDRWDTRIREAIRKADYFLAFLSPVSVSKRGFVQREYRLALDRMNEMISMHPVHFEDSASGSATEIVSLWPEPNEWIHPVDFKKARFRTVEQCREFMIASYVIVKGGCRTHGSPLTLYKSTTSGSQGKSTGPNGRMRRIESWALFRSGQFVHNRAFDEIKDLGDRIHVLEIIDKLPAWQSAGFFRQPQIVTGAFELQLKFELSGVSGRSLTWPLDVLGTADAVGTDKWCQDDDFTVIKQESVTDLQARPRELALNTAIEVLASFGWSAPPREKLVEEQHKRFSAT